METPSIPSFNLTLVVDDIIHNKVDFDELKVRGILKYKIIMYITRDLTIVREYNGLTRFTSEKIARFIEQKNELIEESISEMIGDYKKDEKLIELENPTFDMVRDYVDGFIDIKTLIDEEVAAVTYGGVSEEEYYEMWYVVA